MSEPRKIYSEEVAFTAGLRQKQLIAVATEMADQLRNGPHPLRFTPMRMAVMEDALRLFAAVHSQIVPATSTIYSPPPEAKP